MGNISNLALKKLLTDETYCRKVLPHLKTKYFDGSQMVVFRLLKDYLLTYKTLPTRVALQHEFVESKYNTNVNSEVYDLIGGYYDIDEQEASVNLEWMVDATEKWCKERSIYIAVTQAIKIIDGKDEEHEVGAIPELMKAAISVTFDHNVGHDYLMDAAERYAFYHRTETKLESHLEMFNTITNGGVTRKTLNVILAGTGAGKSLAMCDFAANHMMMGQNVLYITCEMSEEKIAERIDANLFDVEITSVPKLSRGIFDKNISNIKCKTQGKLIIKEYPTASAHAGHFRSLLDELEMKKQFKPDIIFIDYLNICASSRLKKGTDKYEYVKSVAEELRGLAIEYNVPIWTATQTNRDGYDNADVELTNTSESFGLPATADLMIAMIATQQFIEVGQVLWKQLKNRYADASRPSKFVTGVDRSKMRLFDAEESSVEGIDGSHVSDKSPDTENSFSDWEV